MTTLVMNYTVNPLKSFWKNLEHSLTITGYARAASELARQGYYKESKAVMLELKKLKAPK